MKKRFFACLLTVCMLVAMLPTMAFAGVTYADVAGHWAEDAIYAWSDKGIVNGVGKDANGADLFDPDGLLTREQAAAIFARLLKLEKTADVSFFKDVAAGQWYVDGIAKCYAAGIINGTGADTFGTGAYLTRADMFTMFCRALGVEGQDACDKVFDDAREVPVYAKEYTNALVNLGYVGGVTATTLQPLANITRAQMVSLLNKAIVGYITEDGEYEIDEDGIVLVVGEGLDVALSGKGAVSAVITGDDTEIDVTEMDNAEDVVIVIKGANNVKAKASVGTTIVTMDAEDATVNGEDLDEVDEIVVEEEKKPASSGSSSSAGDRDYCRHHDTAFEVLDDDYHREYCEDCGVWVDAKEVHVLGAERAKDPTCTEDGGWYVVCDVCDYEKWIVAEALGHIDENNDNICDRDPSHILCADDDHISEVIPGKAATCTETGLTDGAKCSVCGEILTEQDVIPALGHDFKHCTCVGDSTVECANGCGTEDTLEDDGTGHDFVDGVCSCCGATEDEALKFWLAVESGEAKDDKAVSATVYDDYTAEIYVPNGVKLDASEVTVSAKMKNVGSLDVEERAHSVTINTSLTQTPTLGNPWLDDALDFESATVNVNITDEDGTASTVYNFTGNPTATENVIVAESEDVDATRAAWMKLTDHVDTDTQAADDSYILIANGSSIHLGTRVLEFETDFTDPFLKLDNFNDMDSFQEKVRGALVLNETEEGTEIIVAKGTALAVGSSIAELTDHAIITFEGVEIDEEILLALQASEKTYDLLYNLVNLVDSTIAGLDGGEATIDIEFVDHIHKIEVLDEATCTTDGLKGCECGEGEEVIPATGHDFVDGICDICGDTTEEALKFAVMVESGEAAGEDAVSATAYDDYSAVIYIPDGAKLDASKVTVTAQMQNVGSLGVQGDREHSITVTTGLTQTPTLGSPWLEKAIEFNKADVNVTVKYAGDTEKVAYHFEGDKAGTIVATPDAVQAARDTWALLTDAVDTDTQAADDSYIWIAKGSELTMGTCTLKFEDDADEFLKLDKLGSLGSSMDDFEATVRDAVQLVEHEASEVTVIKVAEGTTLAVGSSIAVLKADCVITVDVATSGDTLMALKMNEAGLYGILSNVINLIDNIIASVDGETVNVVIELK
ncbi:MAG: S-layer homology domain-containing protein [Oscillospiraceae bacterium]|nr:S-layer homology domain-containing protein [Oscillospiraceae bacterium]